MSSLSSKSRKKSATQNVRREAVCFSDALNAGVEETNEGELQVDIEREVGDGGAG